MNLRSILAVSVVALILVACGPQESAPDTEGTWVGTITTEGNVTTVVNESGSVWGGTATGADGTVSDRTTRSPYRRTANPCPQVERRGQHSPKIAARHPRPAVA